MSRLAWFFIAGFLAVPFFHQPVLGVLHALAIVPITPFNLSPTAPLGVPALVSASFWGGAWAVVMLLVLRWEPSKPQPWIKALLFGGIALTAVALVVVFPLKGMGFDVAKLPGRMLIGFLVNAAWGVGTLIFARSLFAR